MRVCSIFPGCNLLSLVLIILCTSHFLMPFAYFLFGPTELAKCEFTVRQTVPEILLTINHLIFHTYFWKGRWGCVCLRIG